MYPRRASATAPCTTGLSRAPPTSTTLQADDPGAGAARKFPAGPTCRASCSRCSRRPRSPTSRGSTASTTTSCSSTPSLARAPTRPCCGCAHHGRAAAAADDAAGRPAIAISTDGKGRFCRLDPRPARASRGWKRRATSRAPAPRRAALVNCLNFGNPEHPEVMWQFAEVIEGIREACEALTLPVVGGNVSFYNESRGADIDPTPVMGVVGVIPARRRAARHRAARRRRDRAARHDPQRARRQRMGGRGARPAGRPAPEADLEAAGACTRSWPARGERRSRGTRLFRRRPCGCARADGDRR